MMSIGRRVKDLREGLGMSQQKLAEMLGVSRPTISQLETGVRKLSADEILKLSQVFNISVDMVLDPKKKPEVVLVEAKRRPETKPSLRINVPRRNLKKFKEVLLYILNKVGSKPNIGETVVYKLLYFMDFDHYEKYEDQLIGATYIKNNYGPTPVEFAKIVSRMIEDEEIEKIESRYFDYPQTKYLPLRNPDLSVLSAHELKTIDDVLSRLSEMNATQISEYSHGDVPWLTTEDGAQIEYEAVFYRTPSYSVREPR